MEELISVLLKCLASVVSIIIGFVTTTYVIPYLKEKKLFIWVQKAVLAAEEKYSGSSGKGAEKKAYVMKFLEERFNLKLSEEELDMLIDATVRETVNVFKLSSSEIEEITSKTYTPEDETKLTSSDNSSTE